jgi:hypothetical protein
MSIANTAYLILVVAGFTSFGVVLFSAWVWTNWAEWTAPAQTAPPESGAASVETRKAA